MGARNVAKDAYPSDNGNWTDMDLFTQAAISDMKKYSVDLHDFIVEISEVDFSWYWTCPQSQAQKKWRRSLRTF